MVDSLSDIKRREKKLYVNLLTGFDSPLKEIGLRGTVGG